MKLAFAAVALTASLLVSVADAGPALRIVFKNASTLTVSDLEVRISGSKDWGADRLPKQGLAPGANAQILLADGVDKSVVDFQFKLSDGSARQLQLVLCNNPTYTFHGRS
jgi:hypothetical protein